MNTEAIRQIVDDGIDTMICRVQAHLGVTEGDIASQHFSGHELRDRITIALMDYVIAEMQAQMEILEEKRNDKT